MTVSEDFTLTFKIVSEKAAQSAYIVTLKSEAQPSEKEVISKGTAVQAEGGGIYVTVENLMSSSEYVIIAAAVSADGLYT